MALAPRCCSKMPFDENHVCIGNIPNQTGYHLHMGKNHKELSRHVMFIYRDDGGPTAL